MGDDDHLRFIKQVSEETKNEICVVHPDTLKSLEPSEFTDIFPSIFDNMLPLINRGVRVNVITPDSYFLILLKQKYDSVPDKHLQDNIDKFLKVGILETKHRFTLIDNYMIIINVENPLYPDKTLGLIKIYDTNFSQKLKAKFEELWEASDTYILSE